MCRRVTHRAVVSGKAYQVALAWLMGQGFEVVPAVGTGDVGHLVDALGAVGVGLSAEEVRWLGEG